MDIFVLKVIVSIFFSIFLASIISSKTSRLNIVIYHILYYLIICWSLTGLFCEDNFLSCMLLEMATVLVFIILYYDNTYELSSEPRLIYMLVGSLIAAMFWGWCALEFGTVENLNIDNLLGVIVLSKILLFFLYFYPNRL